MRREVKKGDCPTCPPLYTRAVSMFSTVFLTSSKTSIIQRTKGTQSLCQHVDENDRVLTWSNKENRKKFYAHQCKRDIVLSISVKCCLSKATVFFFRSSRSFHQLRLHFLHSRSRSPLESVKSPLERRSFAHPFLPSKWKCSRAPSCCSCFRGELGRMDRGKELCRRSEDEKRRASRSVTHFKRPTSRALLVEVGNSPLHQGRDLIALYIRPFTLSR